MVPHLDSPTGERSLDEHAGATPFHEREAPPPMTPAPSLPTEERRMRALPTPVTIERLLVPLDGTPYAERAVPYVAALAAAAGASVTLAHVRMHLALPSIAHLNEVVQSLVNTKPDISVSDFPTYLQWTRHWLTKYVHDVDIDQIDAPSVVSGLSEIGRRWQTSITVIASHTRQGAGRLILGSVADGLVHEGGAPVLVIPPLVSGSAQWVPSPVRVLVPLDGSELAEQALGPVIGWADGGPLAEVMPREVALVTIAPHWGALPHAERYVRATAERLAARLPLAHITAHATVGETASALVELADSGLSGRDGVLPPADLIVMATHGRGGLGRWLYGSVAAHVLPRVRVPVLLVHPRERTAAAPRYDA